MIADGARQEHPVARPDRPGRRAATPAGTTPMPAVVMYMPSALAVLDDLGVAADDRHAGRARPRRPCSATASRARRRASPLEHERRDSAQRPAPDTARSLTVPLTASSPIEPPGNRDRGRPRSVGGEARAARRRPAEQRRVAERRPARLDAGAARRTAVDQRAGWPCRRRRAPSRSRSSRNRGPARGGTPRCARRPRPRATSCAHHDDRRGGRCLAYWLVVVVGGAGALGRHHQRADRRLRRARRAEHLALPRLEHALEHLAALAGLGVGHPHARHREPPLGVPSGVRSRQLQRRLGDEAEPAPLEVRAQLEHLGHRLERRRVALPRHDPGVLVLDLGAALARAAAAASRSTAACRAARSRHTTIGLP